MRARHLILAGIVMSAVIAATSVPTAALAQVLRIGVQRDIPATDPHFSMINPAVSAARHVFDTLVHPDDRQRLHPGLALEWRAVSPTEWEYRLRPNVRFHDGKPFTAEDVAFSLARAPNVPGALSNFGVMTRQITSIRVVDPLTIRLGTAAPFPLMSEHLSAVAIVSKAIGSGAQTADYNDGKAMVGTGPFRFVGWTRADSLRLARNDAWWGPAPAWQEVVFRPIPDDGARVAALLAGTVDAIDMLPSSAAATLRARADLRVAMTVSNRIVYMGLNVAPDPNPLVTDASGAPLSPNPLADQRVRHALSKAINRAVLADRVLDGLAVPAAQFLPDGYPGTSGNLRVEPFDPEGARALLAQAGYPDGFSLTLISPRDRGVGDVKVAEAVAQMFTRIGVRTSVEAMPWAVFQPRYVKADFAAGLRGWGTETGEASMALRSILGTRDPARGWGMANGGRYSNRAADALLEQALGTIAAPAREALVAQASEIVIRDVGIIPLHFDMAAWAMRADIGYTPRSDNYTFAWEFRPVAR
jgi:peptide/nickel transport system substrate-binding protein